LRVLVACEFSGVVRRAFRALGHDAWSCDLLPAEDGSPFHLRGDVFYALRQEVNALFFKNLKKHKRWDLLIAHPPCTYLCRAGWHWVNKPDCNVLPLKGEPRRRAAMEAREFFLKLLNADIPRIAVENPRPICHVELPPSSQKIQPWQFGHGEVKETHLWLKGLPPLAPTSIVAGREAVVHKMPPGPKRKQNRERTYEGIARAMAEQWGNPMNDPMF